MRVLLKIPSVINKNLKNLFRQPRCAIHETKMACSKYEYVKNFELDDRILPHTWIIVRIDGKGFHKFSKKHDFEKPNDMKALNLMNYAATYVMKEFTDIILAFGQSDEYSFVFHKSTDVYNRRNSKIMSNVNSLFTSAYVMHWDQFLPDTKLLYPPCFDARIVLYPTDQNLRDYLSWRQADVHINNLYNTCFWTLVQKGGLTCQQAEERLRGTVSSDKNELLFSEYGINYNNLDPMYKKGTILLRKQINIPGIDKTRTLIVPFYEDMIRDDFWIKNDELLEKKKPKFHELDVTNIPIILKKQIEKHR
ncbi:probable tRNA(His) guanylyltransferase [Culicoides brevitarsis]|uniref:probable tRNA(His) guanylyltransferase n=1 Tax=Culicoides brevitarsis TaxID=469753 RepID=UPI00307C25FB